MIEAFQFLTIVENGEQRRRNAVARNLIVI